MLKAMNIGFGIAMHGSSFGTAWHIPDEYSHNDKPLVLSTKSLDKPRLIKQVVWETTKHGVEIRLQKHINY